MKEEHAQEQGGAEQPCCEICGGANEQADGGGEQKDAGGDGERASDGIPGRPGEREDEEVLQAKPGEGEGEDDSGAGDGAIHRCGDAEVFGVGRHDTGIERRGSRGCDEPHRSAIGKGLWGMG
jgi:hypothetical protein